MCGLGITISHEQWYYSMTLKFIVWINVKALNQQEVVKPNIVMRNFGSEGTHCPLLMGYRIDYVRSDCEGQRRNI